MRDDSGANKAGAKRLTRLDLKLAEELNEYYYDPLGWVYAAFPWGKAGTRLAKQSGPDEWQIEFLEDFGEALQKGIDVADALPLMFAVASGHGIGKTALIAWIILWFISTRDNPQIVVTAGKREQLESKTWRELAKWLKLSIVSHWFTWTATSLAHVLAPDTWKAKAVAWSKHSSENFAGTHEENVLVIYDEASAIDDLIWEVTDGAMTTPGAIWIAFGNPTKTNGRFNQCFGKYRPMWNCRHIDSRTAKMANRRLLDQWVAMHGEDSDFVRVRVRGQFPRAGDLQFISSEDVALANARKDTSYPAYGKILSVDVARHGMDQTVICRRQGRKVFKFKRMRIPDLMQIAARVAEVIDEFQPEVVYIDATGMGWGVVDRLHQMNYTNVIGVQTGERAYAPERYVDRRAELYYDMREFIRDGADLPDDQELTDELTSIEYGYDGKNRYVLESKKQMKERDLPSPDTADALALSFTAPVAPSKPPGQQWRKRLKSRTRTSSMAA